jgi:hypothetical protein
MKKALNFITAGYGILLVLSGLLKMLAGFTAFTLTIGGATLTINHPTSAFYIIMINFIGGGSMIYHAFGSLKYIHKPRDPITGTPLDHQPDQSGAPLPVFSKPLLISGFITIVLCLWLLIRSFVMLASFEDGVLQYWPLLICVLLFYLPHFIVPLIVVFRNIGINNKLEDEKLRMEMRRRMG